MRALVHFVATQQIPLQSNGALHLVKVVVTTGLSKQIQTFFCKISKLRCSAAQSFLDRFSSIIEDCDLSFRLEVNFEENGVMNNFGEKRGHYFMRNSIQGSQYAISLFRRSRAYFLSILYILNNALPQSMKQRNLAQLSFGFPPNK